MNITCHSAVIYLCWGNMVLSVPFLDCKWRGTYCLDSCFWIVMSHRGFFHQRLNHPQASLRRLGVHQENLWWELIIHCWPPAVHVRLPALGGLQRAWPQKSFPSWWENLSHERLINHQGLYFRIFSGFRTVCVCPDGFWIESGIWLSRTLTFWAFILNWHKSSHQILKSSRSWKYLFPPSSSDYCLQISLQPDIPHSVRSSRQELWLRKKSADIISIIVSF